MSRRPCGRRAAACRSAGSGASPRGRARRRPRQCPTPASSPCPSRSSTLDSPGTVSSCPISSWAGTSSPVSTVAPSAKSSAKPDRSRPPSRSRNVSATDTRSRWWTTSASRPSSPISNSSLPSSVGSTVGTSQTRATAGSSPVRAARRSAEAATPSAAAIANRALTPARWSTDADAAQRPGEPGQHLQQVLGHVGHERGLLGDDRHLLGHLGRVVGPDLGPEPVLERGDDPAAVGVVLGVGAGHQQQVQRQPQAVAAHLDVALLEHVEHRDLDPLGEVRQLVDAEDAAVGARDEPVVHGLRVARGSGPPRP